MNNRLAMGWILVVGLALWSCSGAPSPAKAVWTAQPALAEATNQLFKATLEPRKGQFPYFTHFFLTLANTSDTDMVVDWNATQYLFNGKAQGVLVFEGIDPKAVGAATVPAETVVPGTILTRDVMPLRLVAWSPVREKTTENRGITPGMLPAGMNGVRLAVRHADGLMAIPLSVNLSSEAAR